MKHHEHEIAADHPENNGDGVVDAIAAIVVVICVAAMGIIWVSGQ